MAKNKINDIISQLKKDFPGAVPKAAVANPLDTLIATMLSQNTTDKTSYRAFMNLKKNFRGWEDVMNSPPDKVKEAIRVCGLANQKTKSIQSMLRQLKAKHGKLSLNYLKKMTDEEIYKDLLQYDGVGLKTISCVLAFSLGRDVCAVDTHVHRLSNRLALASAKTPDKTFLQIKDIIPKGKKLLLHRMFIRHGRNICRSNNPLCGRCRLYDLCEFNDKELYAMKNEAEPKENDFIILEHI